jgi:hypothetical protein
LEVNVSSAASIRRNNAAAPSAPKELLDYHAEALCERLVSRPPPFGSYAYPATINQNLTRTAMGRCSESPVFVRYVVCFPGQQPVIHTLRENKTRRNDDGSWGTRLVDAHDHDSKLDVADSADTALAWSRRDGGDGPIVAAQSQNRPESPHLQAWEMIASTREQSQTWLDSNATMTDWFLRTVFNKAK